MPPSLPGGRRVPIRDCVIVADPDIPAVLRRGLAEAAEYIAELTGEKPRVTGSDPGRGTILTARAGSGATEGFRIRVESRAARTVAAVAGLSPAGAARGVSRLLGAIGLKDGVPVLPAPLDLASEPWVRLRGMHLNGWAANHPYSFRSWSEEEWRRWIDILFHEAVNLLFLWPGIDIIPTPLAPEDEAYLEEVRRVVAYAREERGMQVWILHSANRIALSHCGEKDPRRRPYWLPEAHVDLDPGEAGARRRILHSREPLYRIVGNADAFVIIDSDPGGWRGSPVSAYLDLLQDTRTAIDGLAENGPAVKLVSWLWQGWGYTTWNPQAREPVIAETVRGMRDRLPEPWMLIAGAIPYLPFLARLSVLDRTIALPYGVIEAEPSVPFTNVDPASIDGALDGIAAYPGLAGAMGNLQCPVLQLPQVHHLMQGLWEGARTARGGDLPGLARLLHPGAAQDVADALAALNALDPVYAARAHDAVQRLLQPEPPTAGLIGRLLFPSRAQALQDIGSQLAVRESEAALASALEEGRDIEALRPLVAEWFRRCLAWERRHGYFGVLRLGRLDHLFPRPPVPRDTVRTWPPFVPYAVGLRRVLAAAGDSSGEVFFAGMRAGLEAEFEPEKVRRGCLEAMQVMMARPEAL